MEWANLAKFQTWCYKEEHVYSIKLIVSTSWAGRVNWSGCQLFVCRHEESGGRKTPYQKIHPDWKHKIGTKKSGCGCHVIIKLYPHMSTILGCYISQHDYEIGSANIAYTHLSSAARE